MVDYGNSMVNYQLHATHSTPLTPYSIRPDPTYLTNYPPPRAWKAEPITSLCSKFAHMSVNKTKQPVLCCTWTPEGRRILTGAMSGEFTLWHGMTFNFEMLMQAHENAVRCMTYSKSGDWLISGDQDGALKVWQPNFNNVHIVNAHRESVRDVSWSPSDAKFATCSDDGLVKVWSFATMQEEATFKGHGWDVKCCDWHPSLGLIASGSKDNLVKLWDPRMQKSLSTLHGFKNTVSKTKFQPTGSQQLLASGSRDNSVRILDLRAMKHTMVLRGHESDVSALAWHPCQAELLTTGTQDGTINHFLIDNPVQDALKPALTISKAHGWPIWDLSYHPTGHILCSASNDKSIRLWTRARPDDPTAFHDRFYQNTGAEDSIDELEKFRQRERERERQKTQKTSIPGISMEVDS